MARAEDTGAGLSPTSTNRPPEDQGLNPSDRLEQSDSTDNQGPAREMDESSRLRKLQAHVRDQDDLERDIGRQVRELFLTSW
jgi:hypothetical protein